MRVYAFTEGATEEKVLERLGRMEPELKLEHIPGQGKWQINQKLAKTLGPLFNGREPIRCLILRDLDTHDQESTDRLRQGVDGALAREFEKRGIRDSARTVPHGSHDNIFTLTMSQPDFRLAMHIASYRYQPDFIKSTIDDYVLDLALKISTANRLLSEKTWQIPAEKLIDKVKTKIPSLLQQNGIQLQEAKDYVRLYAAVIQAHTSPPVFAQKTLANADPEQIKQVFAPLLAALEFLRSGS